MLAARKALSAASTQAEHCLEKSRPGLYVKRPLTTDVGSTHVKVSCASHGSHKVSPLGFVLLEDVEGSFGTSE